MVTQIARIFALEMRDKVIVERAQKGQPVETGMSLPHDSEREYRFHDDHNVYVVRWIPKPLDFEIDNGMYISVGAAGEPCPCCKGSGVRSELVPSIAR